MGSCFGFEVAGGGGLTRGRAVAVGSGFLAEAVPAATDALAGGASAVADAGADTAGGSGGAAIGAEGGAAAPEPSPERRTAHVPIAVITMATPDTASAIGRAPRAGGRGAGRSMTRVSPS